MLTDMGAALDWFTRMASEEKWRVMRVNAGPGKDFFLGLHPDVLRVMMRSGQYSAQTLCHNNWLWRALCNNYTLLHVCN